MLSVEDIIKVIEAASSANLAELTISQDTAEITLKFKEVSTKSTIPLQAPRLTQAERLEEDEVMVRVAIESAVEDEEELTDDVIAEWELNNPAEIDRQIALGNLVQGLDGRVQAGR